MQVVGLGHKCLWFQPALSQSWGIVVSRSELRTDSLTLIQCSCGGQPQDAWLSQSTHAHAFNLYCVGWSFFPFNSQPLCPHSQAELYKLVAATKETNIRLKIAYEAEAKRRALDILQVGFNQVASSQARPSQPSDHLDHLVPAKPSSMFGDSPARYYLCCSTTCTHITDERCEHPCAVCQMTLRPHIRYHPALPSMCPLHSHINSINVCVAQLLPLIRRGSCVEVDQVTCDSYVYVCIFFRCTTLQQLKKYVEKMRGIEWEKEMKLMSCCS